MSHSEKIKTIIEEAVAEVFEVALPNLRAQIVSRAVEELQSLEPAPGSLPTDLLNAAAAVIHADAGKVPDATVNASALSVLCRIAALWLELTALRKAGATMPAEEAPAHAQAAAHLQEAAVAQVAVPREGDEIHKKAQR